MWRILPSGLAGLAVSAITLSTLLAPASPASASAPTRTGLFQTFTAENGTQLRYHSFDGGNNGVVFYFDGDGTDSFDTPRTGADSPDRARGHVQRIRETAEAEGFDLIFIDHPGGGESWWNGTDTEAVVPAVQELVTESGVTRAQFVGYSGGAEFLARHLLIDDTSWLPEKVGAAMIGGGGVGGQSPKEPKGDLSEANLYWAVGEEDSFGATAYSTWSALESAKQGARAYADSGYERARAETVPNTDHTGYDFAGITRAQLKEFTRISGSTQDDGGVSPAPNGGDRNAERSRDSSTGSNGSTSADHGEDSTGDESRSGSDQNAGERKERTSEDKSVTVPDPARSPGAESSGPTGTEVLETQDGISSASPNAEGRATSGSPDSIIGPVLTVTGVVAAFGAALLFFFNRRAKRRHS